MLEKEMKVSLKAHLAELKKRILYSLSFFLVIFLIAYFYAQDLYFFLLNPLVKQWISPDKHMIYTNLAEIFFSYINLAYYFSLFITIPFMLCQLYVFIAPGLYKNEKKLLIPILVLSPILFIFGAIFVYYVIFPLAWNFFLNFEHNAIGNIPIKLEAKVAEYLNLCLKMIIAFGTAFQMPIILVLLAKIGFISASSLRKKRRFAIVLIFIISAILTPPDVLSQIGLAIPMLILYELSIIICSKFVNQQ